MGRLAKASFISLLFTAYGGSIYYLFSLAVTLAGNGDVVQTFINAVEGCFLCWLFLTVIFYEILGAFDDLNKASRRRDERENTDKDGETPRS